jgi:hypothetical protein
MRRRARVTRRSCGPQLPPQPGHDCIITNFGQTIAVSLQVSLESPDTELVLLKAEASLQHRAREQYSFATASRSVQNVSLSAPRPLFDSRPRS